MSLFGQLKDKIASMVIKGLVSTVNDAGGFQVLQVTGLTNETIDGIPRMQDYGFTSHPVAGAETLLLAVGGDRSDTVAICVGDSRYRIELAAGEVAIYNKFDQYVKLKDGEIAVVSDSVKIGSETATQKIPLGDDLKTYLESFIDTFITGWTVVLADGGTALKTALAAWKVSHPTGNYLSSKNKVD